MKTQRFIETRDRECHRHRNYQSQDPFQLHPWVLEHNDNKKLPSIDCHPIEPPAVSQAIDARLGASSIHLSSLFNVGPPRVNRSLPRVTRFLAWKPRERLRRRQ